MKSFRMASGEKKLMLAILKDALKCYRRNVSGKSVHSQKIFHETEEWFHEEETSYLYSFLNICSWLGVDFKMIREKLKEMKELKEEVTSL
jgi:hypothetical protein